MSHEDDKVKHSRRLLKDDNAINRQVRIARGYGIGGKSVEQPHRNHKKHILNCGDPHCYMCANPRRVFKEKTMQERRFEQTEKFTDED